MNNRPTRLAVAAVAIVLALAVQTTILSRLPLPGNQPSLLLVLVVASALAGGVPAGVGMGFATGLAADLISSHPLGLLALVFLLVGWVVGSIDLATERGVTTSLLIVAGAAVGSFLGYLLVLSLTASSGPDWGAQLTGLPAGALYDVMLTPFVLPVVAAVERRLRVLSFR